jgi:hypothetical protein
VLGHRASNVLPEMSQRGDPSLNGGRRLGNRVNSHGRPHKGLPRRETNPGLHHRAISHGLSHRDNNRGSKANRVNSCPDNLGLQNRGSIPGKDNQDPMVPLPGPTGGPPTSLRRSPGWHHFVP